MRMRLRYVKVIFACSIVLLFISVINIRNRFVSYGDVINKYIKAVTKEMPEELTTSASKYNIYYGMLHSHTSYSDGQGTPAEAFEYARTKAKQMDFFAITEHSQTFDNCDKATLKNGSSSNEWKDIVALSDKLTTEDFVALYGYEMTWKVSQNFGHINTFNTKGFVSARSKKYNNDTTALKDYYNDLVANAPNSFSQFNHPSVKWGHFRDFEYVSSKVDSVFSLLEMPGFHTTKNIEEYCKYYQRALDKGWHISPSNNQDNHKKDWGTVNARRSVILAKTLTKKNVYDAIKYNRTYSTEDLDFYLKYTLNGYVQGSKINVGRVNDTVKVQLSLNDPTDTAIGKLELVVNNGKIIYNQDIREKKKVFDIDVPAEYSFYYVRIKQKDGDSIVSAPVWLGNYKASTPVVKPTTAAPKTVKPSTATPKTTKPTTVAPQTEGPMTATPTMTTPQTEEPMTASPTMTTPQTEEPTIATPYTVEPTEKILEEYEDKSMDAQSRPEVAVGDDSETVKHKLQDIGKENVYDESPETGDNSKLYWYIALAVTLFVSIIFEGIYILKNRKKY